MLNDDARTRFCRQVSRAAERSRSGQEVDVDGDGCPDQDRLAVESFVSISFALMWPTCMIGSPARSNHVFTWPLSWPEIVTVNAPQSYLPVSGSLH